MADTAVLVTYVLTYGSIVAYAAWLHRRMRHFKPDER